MAVTITKLDKVIKEASIFIVKAKAARRKLCSDKLAYFGCKETGAVRRASMDLSRILVDIRRGD